MGVRDNICRGKILSLLRELFPQGTDQMTIIGIYYEYFKKDDIIDSLEYLVSKNYANKKSIPHPVRKNEIIETYAINAHGIDLCDGAITDVGITIAPEA